MVRVMLMVLALLGLAGYALANDDEDGVILRRVENKLVIQSEEPPSEPEYAPPPRPTPQRPARPGHTPPPVHDEERPAPAVAVGVDDDHYIQGNDYFVQRRGLGRQAWMYVTLAKVITPPSDATRDEGEFMEVKSGRNLWTRHCWRTRIAAVSELRLGMHVIMFNDNRHDGIYMAPHSKERARGGTWFYAKITDLSDLYKGYVTVSGNYKVSVNIIRLLLD